ncbi:MAG: hypothetical protein K2X11_19220 [Acetobacteraceae bacterium]|nr:hypothetical protein [Acetobacteraceae bacterium]
MTLLIFLLPALLPLWLWAMRSVFRDALRPTATGPALARCGLPDRPLGPCPAAVFLQRHSPRRPGAVAAE